MNPLLYAIDAKPRTNAEAKAFQKLIDIAKVAELWLDLFFYDNAEFLYAWPIRGMDAPEKLCKLADDHRALIKKVEHKTISELICLIDEYNEILAEIKTNFKKD